MKAKTHPQFYPDALVTCSCGNRYTTGSTRQTIQVDVCSKCHPLYTGEHRFVDTKGKVEKFRKKMEVAQEMRKQLAQKKTKKQEKSEKTTKSLRELLAEG